MAAQIYMMGWFDGAGSVAWKMTFGHMDFDNGSSRYNFFQGTFESRWSRKNLVVAVLPSLVTCNCSNPVWVARSDSQSDIQVVCLKWFIEESLIARPARASIELKKN